MNKRRKKLIPSQKLASITPDIWQMPPYLVARFGGEISKIMVQAAQEYISQQCLTELKKGFIKETTPDKCYPENQN